MVSLNQAKLSQANVCCSLSFNLKVCLNATSMKSFCMLQATLTALSARLSEFGLHRYEIPTCGMSILVQILSRWRNSTVADELKANAATDLRQVAQGAQREKDYISLQQSSWDYQAFKSRQQPYRPQVSCADSHLIHYEDNSHFSIHICQILAISAHLFRQLGQLNFVAHDHDSMTFARCFLATV